MYIFVNDCNNRNGDAMIYLIIAIVILILLSTMKFRIMNYKDQTDVYIKILYVIKIHFNYEKFINKINFKKDKDFIKQISSIKAAFPIINITSKYTVIENIEVIKLINLTKELNIFSNTMFLSSSKILSTYLNNSFKEVKKENFYIQRNDYGRNEYDFDITLSIRNYLLFLVGIKGLILYIRSKLNGSSNKYTAKG